MKNGKAEDPFDPAKLRIRPETFEANRQAQGAAEAADASKDPQGKFVMMPLRRHLQLAGAPSSVIWLAYHLHFLSWKAHGRPFRLANGTLTGRGMMGRHTKLRALRDLERRGWIKARIEARKSPIITLIEEPGSC